MDFLETGIENLPSTSAITLRRLKMLKIKTYWDLINYFPFRYENFSLISTIDKLQEGERVTVKGQIIDIKNEYTKKGLNLQKAILYDKTGKIELIWYNQPFLIRLIKVGNYLSVAGEVKKYLYHYSLQVEEYEILKTLNDETIHTGRIIPIYPEKKGLSSKTLREKIWHLLQLLKTPSFSTTDLENPIENRRSWSFQEILPREIISYNNLLDELSAYQNIHFPRDLKMAKKARERLAFDEIFIIQLSSQLIKKEWAKEKVSHPFQVSKFKKQLADFIKKLPFELTKAQKRSLGEILTDLAKSQPMNRLLQGDVGSGKTVVAAIASYLAYLNGFKTLLMAPTEILASQHYQTFIKMFQNNGRDAINHFSTKNLTKNPSICLYTSSVKPKPQQLKNAEIIVGTHALIDKKAFFEKVGLVIIDEQHKFGVVQRAMLKEKGVNPHLLTMTATPIPRTVALTLYGELELSVIDEMPKGRILTKTFLVPKEKRVDAYSWIKNQIINEKSQVFIVCPLIEESESETMKSVKAAKKEFDYLKKEVFFEFRLGLLHGRMKTKEKEEVMNKFARGEIDILVTTSVVEVGIDVPNASIIVIEAAERFGLAQLHQLRGRVGRSNKQSYCLLFSENLDEGVLKRLMMFTKINNGFDLAEYDLKIRGVGEIYGTKQHGFINLKIASLSDFQLIEKTKAAVDYFLKKYQIKDFLNLKKRLEEYRISVIARD